MHKSHLLLGSNLGESRRHLRNALGRLAAFGQIRMESLVYRSAAWGNISQPDFLNMTIELQTELSPQVLLKEILHIETSMGRKRTEKWGPRLIDIDILLYDDDVINSDSLVIPHPEMHNRRFTLVPLAEIAPDAQHPAMKKSIKQLLLECPDNLAVESDGVLGEN
jgi:2-amino-4-hydroxy-6-hydroxymethyldihydropteridine diphosphokinase